MTQHRIYALRNNNNYQGLDYFPGLAAFCAYQCGEWGEYESSYSIYPYPLIWISMDNIILYIIVGTFKATTVTLSVSVLSC